MNESESIISSGEKLSQIILLNSSDYAQWTENSSEIERELSQSQGFSGKPGQTAWIKNAEKLNVLVGWDGESDLETLGHLPYALPEGIYEIDKEIDLSAIVGWGLGAYSFNRYKKPLRAPAQLQIKDQQLREKALAVVDAVCLGRDLINTPASDMSPSHLEAEIFSLAQQYDASFNCWIGDELLDNGCGAIHAVGRASDDPPRLVDLNWGDDSNPQVCLVGKGVTFDSGGLDLKSATGMRQMKKDMGGAAIAIGLAKLIMSQKLPIQLRLLIPTAENSISGNAFRPGDVLSTRKGLTVEIDNTDAEGRLLLCDALALASEGEPDLIIDFATLTGAARSAVGAEISAMFTDSDSIANKLFAHGETNSDPVWRMPLHEPYNSMLDSKIGDLVNSSSSGYAGAITAALFLKHFVSKQTDWVHFDLMAYNTKTRPARPEGGEAMALRAVYSYLEEAYAES